MRPQKVLICAEPSTAERVADVLRSRGYEAETAGDRDRAVELAELNHPEVVLTWSDLPGTDACEMVREVRGGSSERRVAAVLRQSDAGQASAVLEAGADALLLDNPDLEFLAWAVDRVFEGGLVVDPALARSLVSAPGASQDGDGPAGGSSERDEPLPDESGVQFQECDVAQIVQEGAAEAAGGYPAAVVVKDTGMPALTAVAEPAALRAVIRILVQTAYADSEDDSDVSIKAQQGDAGITVHVTDRGPGLDREQMAALATAGKVAEGEPVPPLALAKRLVALHGGILWAEPLPAGGTRFAFTIPQKPPVLEGETLEDALRTLELVQPPSQPAEDVTPAEAEPEAEASVPEEPPDLAAEAEAAAAAEATFAELASADVEELVLSVDDLLQLDPEATQVEEGAAAEAEPLPALESEPVPDKGAAAAEASAMAEAALEGPEEGDGVVLSLADLVQLDPEAVHVTEEAEAPEAEPAEAQHTEPEPQREPVEIELYDREEAEVEEPVEVMEPVEVEVPEPEPERESVEVEVPEPEPEPEPVEVKVPEPEPEPIEVPEPVPVEVKVPEPEPEPEPEPIPVAAAATSAGAEPRAAKKPMELEVTVKRFIPDPLDPATAMLRSLSEDYDPQADGFLERR